MIQFIAALLFLSSCGLIQKKKPSPKPPEAKSAAQLLRFEDRIIHPECVYQLQGESLVDLRVCGKDASPIVLEKDFVATYRSKGQGFVRYQVITSPAPQEFLVSFLWNGGGSGTFSGVQLLGLEGSELRLLKAYEFGGDRCNGGIRITKTSAGEIELVENLTPVDFLELGSRGKDLDPEVADELETSAASCYALNVYRFNKKKDFDLLGTKTQEIGETVTDLRTRDSLQGCFDVEFKKLPSKLLQPKDIEAFAKNFAANCR